MSEIAYVMREKPGADHRLRIAEGLYPRFEVDRATETGLADAAALRPIPSGSLAALWSRAGGLGASVALLNEDAGRHDAYVATGEDIGMPLALAMIARPRRRPVHMTFHGHYIGGRKFDAVIAVLRNAPFVHFHPLSTSLGHMLVERFGVPARRCHATGHSVDTDFFRPTDVAPSAVVSAGMARRDYHTLVQAAAGLEVPVRIAADSTWFREAVNVDVASLPSHVELKSQGDYRGLRALYETAAFVVVPMQDVEHACGYAVIAEAMAMGKAVIATRTRAPSDYVIEGQTGFLVPPGDVDALARRMAQLLADPHLASGMGRAARTLVEQHHTLDRFCARLKENVLATKK